MSTPVNALNISSAGLVKFDGTSAFSAVTVTNHDVLVGSTSNGITSVAPSATSGVALISQGASSNPTFGTVAIAGGGTNATSFTQSNGIVTYNGTSLVNYAGPQIDSSGRLTNTSQPSFLAYLTSTVANATGDGTEYAVIFDGVSYNVGSNYNNSTGIFTAPVAGKYCFSCTVSSNGYLAANSDSLVQIFINGTFQIQFQRFNGFTCRSSTGDLNQTGSITLNLSANDTVAVNFYCGGGTKVVGVEGTPAGFITFFCGFLI